jgi:hypothetical protein
MSAQSQDDEVQRPAVEATTDADVEGHSVFSAIVTSGALRARAPLEGQTWRTRDDEALPPLTKPFPSMRAARRT